MNWFDFGIGQGHIKDASTSFSSITSLLFYIGFKNMSGIQINYKKN